MTLEAAAERHVGVLTGGLVPVDADAVGHVYGVPVRIQFVVYEGLRHEVVDVGTVRVSGDRLQLQDDGAGKQPARLVLVVEAGSDRPFAAAQRVRGGSGQLRGKAELDMRLILLMSARREPETGQQIVDAGFDLEAGGCVAGRLPRDGPRIIGAFQVGDVLDLVIAQREVTLGFQAEGFRLGPFGEEADEKPVAPGADPKAARGCGVILSRRFVPQHRTHGRRQQAEEYRE